MGSVETVEASKLDEPAEGSDLDLDLTLGHYWSRTRGFKAMIPNYDGLGGRHSFFFFFRGVNTETPVAHGWCIKVYKRKKLAIILISLGNHYTSI